MFVGARTGSRKPSSNTLDGSRWISVGPTSAVACLKVGHTVAPVEELHALFGGNCQIFEGGRQAANESG
jgi:hypothetical protein